jgi:adenylosuccinate lyase
VQHLNEYFSEYGLMKYRVQVEIEYLLFLEKKNFLSLPANVKKHLEKLSENFGPDEAQQIKHIEATTNHDIKAVEYF